MLIKNLSSSSTNENNQEISDNEKKLHLQGVIMASLNQDEIKEIEEEHRLLSKGLGVGVGLNAQKSMDLSACSEQGFREMYEMWSKDSEYRSVCAKVKS